MLSAKRGIVSGSKGIVGGNNSAIMPSVKDIVETGAGVGKKNIAFGAGGHAALVERGKAGKRAVIMSRFGAFMDKLFAHTQWIAGQKKEDALRVALELQKRGVGAIVDNVGESVSTKEAVEATKNEYLGLIALLGEKEVRGARIAVRPSALGADIGVGGWEYCKEVMGCIVSAAKEAGYIVDIDMEDHEYTDGTLKLYRELQREHGNMGTVLQATLRRSKQDLRDVLGEFGAGAQIRLVKGIYDEPEEIAYTTNTEIHGNFLQLITTAFEEGAPGTNVIVATHHEGQMLDALRLLEKHPDKTLEIQMLMGVKPGLAKIMEEAAKKLGFKFTIYVPYGEHPAAYCMRRMAESGSFATMMARTLPIWEFLKPFVVDLMPLVGRLSYRAITGNTFGVKAAGNGSVDKAKLEERRDALFAYLRAKGIEVPD